MPNLKMKFHASSPCKDLCTRTFLESRIGHSKFDPSLGNYPEVSLMELSRRCEERCDNPYAQFPSYSGSNDQSIQYRAPEKFQISEAISGCYDCSKEPEGSIDRVMCEYACNIGSDAIEIM